jgi:hypothetical protein
MKQFEGVPFGSRQEVEAVYKKILALDPDTVEGIHEPPTTNGTKLVRATLKKWGIKGCAVRKCRYGWYPEVMVPRIRTELGRTSEEFLNDLDDTHQVARHLQNCLTTVYPKLTNRYPDNNPLNDGYIINLVVE